MKIEATDADTTFEPFGGPTAIVPGERHYGLVVVTIEVPSQEIADLHEHLDGGFSINTEEDVEVKLDDKGNMQIVIVFDGHKVVDEIGPVNERLDTTRWSRGYDYD